MIIIGIGLALIALGIILFLTATIQYQVEQKTTDYSKWKKKADKTIKDIIK